MCQVSSRQSSSTCELQSSTAYACASRVTQLIKTQIVQAHFKDEIEVILTELQVLESIERVRATELQLREIEHIHMCETAQKLLSLLGTCVEHMRAFAIEIGAERRGRRDAAEVEQRLQQLKIQHAKDEAAAAKRLEAASKVTDLVRQQRGESRANAEQANKEAQGWQAEATKASNDLKFATTTFENLWHAYRAERDAEEQALQAELTAMRAELKATKAELKAANMRVQALSSAKPAPKGKDAASVFASM